MVDLALAGNDDNNTVFVGNLDESASEEILFELFLQAGPVKSVRIPWDNRSGKQRRYGFVTFKHNVSVSYSINLLNGIKLFNCSLNLNTKQPNKNNGDGQVDSGRNLDERTPGGAHFERFRPYQGDVIRDDLAYADARRSSYGSPHMDARPRYPHGMDPYAYNHSGGCDQYMNDGFSSMYDNRGFKKTDSPLHSSDRSSHRRRIDRESGRSSSDRYRSSDDRYRNSDDRYDTSSHRSRQSHQSNRHQPYGRR